MPSFHVTSEHLRHHGGSAEFDKTPYLKDTIPEPLQCARPECPKPHTHKTEQHGCGSCWFKDKRFDLHSSRNCDTHVTLGYNERIKYELQLFYEKQIQKQIQSQNQVSQIPVPPYAQEYARTQAIQSVPATTVPFDTSLYGKLNAEFVTKYTRIEGDTCAVIPIGSGFVGYCRRSGVGHLLEVLIFPASNIENPLIKEAIEKHFEGYRRLDLNTK
jgi:hypothetical protein